MISFRYIFSSPLKLQALTVFLLMALTCLTVLAQENKVSPPIDIDSNVNKTAVTTGDLLTFTTIITADSDIKPFPPDFSPLFKGFEIVDNGIKSPIKKDKQLKLEIWYRLRADEIGEFIIPSIAVNFSAPDPKYSDKTIQGQILTPEVKISVLSFLNTENNPQDIKDIKSIIEIGPDWHQYILYFILLILIFSLFFLWVTKNKHSRKTKIKLEQHPLTPHEIAFRQINKLNSQRFLQKGMFREHYFELSEIFRCYLGQRFRCQAMDWTTEEIIEWMDVSRFFHVSIRVQMSDILKNIDQVKYAKAQPTSYISDNIMKATIKFIQETMSQTEPEKPTRKSAI